MSAAARRRRAGRRDAGATTAASQRRGCQPERAAVRLGDPAGDRQAEAGAAAGGGAAGRIDAEEALEDLFAQRLGHAGAAVVDLDARGVAGGGAADAHLAAARRVADGVLEQVAEPALPQV